MILCKRSRLCDKVYSLQSQIKRDFSDALSMPRNETIKISLKMTIFRRRQKSPFRFPLRSGNRLKNDEMTAPSKSGLSKDMDEFLSLLISARSMSCPFFKLQGVGTDATHTISSKLHRTRILQHQKRMYKSQFRCVHHSSAASSNQKPFSHAIDGHAICKIIAPFFSQIS